MFCNRLSALDIMQACYVVARVAREMYEELPGRSKDYIQEPKGNGYQSLHCTIKLPPVTVECDTTSAAGSEECVLDQGPTCELQIRTQSKWAATDCYTTLHTDTTMSQIICS